MQITDAHYDEFCERGFVVLKSYMPEEAQREAAAALRRLLKPWEEVKDNPPRDLMDACGFPYPEQCLNRLILDPQLLAFARRVLRTEDIFYRAGVSLVRYAGFRDGSGGLHIDNPNNSLLPPSDSDPTFAQMVCWWHFEDVDEDQAPLHLIPKMYGDDTSKFEKLVVPGGSVCLFNNYLWHSASDYTRADGQRYSLGYMFGRADHHWEGFRHYTSLGYDPAFQQFIGSLTPQQRELFHFPPVGHPPHVGRAGAAVPRLEGAGLFVRFGL